MTHNTQLFQIGEVVKIMGVTRKKLLAFKKDNNIETTGPFRSIYLEGPPDHGQHSADYITQVAVPITE